jgi:hypothetical protein
MSIKNSALYPLVLLFISAFWTEAHAGVTISDRRYWPNEARGTPGQVIEIRPPSAGSATEPRVLPRKRARRAR